MSHMWRLPSHKSELPRTGLRRGLVDMDVVLKVPLKM